MTVQVTGTLSQNRPAYSGGRASRIASISPNVRLVQSTGIESDRFASLIDGEQFDVIGIHHATVGDYKSGDFDIVEAVRRATARARESAKALAANGTSNAIITRSVFEGRLGNRSENRPVSPYAIAKTATSEIWSDALRTEGIAVKDFVITNPFGPFEEPRFVNYLVRTWKAGEVPMLQAPQYIRDNVPISLLAQSYATYALSDLGTQSFCPSYKPMSNLEFAKLIARKFSKVLGSEPLVHSASDPQQVEPLFLGGIDAVDFDSEHAEQRFWNDYANFYKTEN